MFMQQQFSGDLEQRLLTVYLGKLLQVNFFEKHFILD